MAHKPLIGITSRVLTRPDLSSPLIGHHLPYAGAVIQAGGIPIGLPVIDDQGDLTTILDSIDGMLLTGGEDVDPSFYGEEPHPKLGTISRERDLAEMAFVKQAYARRLPTLAICRGIQVVNVALGGSLHQDLESQLPSSVEHRLPDDAVDGPRAQHTIHIEKNSLLAELLGVESLLVNSSHHQAVNRVSSELRVVATAPDGVIEAVEGKGRQFFLGVQCHPEALVAGATKRPDALPEHFARWLRVFKTFVDEASKDNK